MSTRRTIGSTMDVGGLFNKRKVGSIRNGRAFSADEIPTVFLYHEKRSLSDKPHSADVRISVDSTTAYDSGHALRSGPTSSHNQPNMTYVAMNADPTVVRRTSQQFGSTLTNEEEEENKDVVGELPQKSMMQGRGSSKSTTRPSSLHLHPDRFSARRGVTGSMSVPVNKMSIRIFGSEKAVLDEQQRLQKAGRYIIHPYSNFRLIWDSLTLFLLLTNIILIPVAIAFWKEDDPTWLPFKAFSDIWFLVDIILNFRTGIVLDGPDSEVILEPNQIRTMYIKTWFFIDFVSTFPFDLPFTLSKHADSVETIGGETGFKALGLLRLAKILALLRLLRVSRFIRYIKQWEEIFNFQYEVAIALIRIMNLILLMLFICHFNGCMQYMVPMFLGFPEGTWVQVRNLQRDEISTWERYSWSVFKSTSHMLCIGYGQFPPKSIIDLWVTYFSMCSGAMCFALFIGNATSLIQSMDASKRSYKEKYMQVKEYMQFRKLPSKLRRKISDYYENKYQGKMFDENMILSELNHNLREEVINYNCKELVEQVPFFSDADPIFVSEVLEKLCFEVFLPGETIIKEGAVGDRMYFVNHGTVRITSEQHNITQRLSDGCYFGEIALLQQDLLRVATVEAESYCYLYTLSVDDFNTVVNRFPMQKTRLILVAQNRMHAATSNVHDSFTSTCSIVPVDAPSWTGRNSMLANMRQESVDRQSNDEDSGGNAPIIK